MNLKPLDDRIVVKPSEAEQTTASGLVIPDTAKTTLKGLVTVAPFLGSTKSTDCANAKWLEKVIKAPKNRDLSFI